MKYGATGSFILLFRKTGEFRFFCSYLTSIAGKILHKTPNARNR